MSNRPHSTVNNLVVTDDSISFDVVASDTFAVTQVAYWNYDMYLACIDPINVTVTQGDPITETATVTITLDEINTALDKELVLTSFSDLFSIFRVLTSETDDGEEDCDCDPDYHPYLNSTTLYDNLTTDLIAEIKCDPCLTIDDKLLEKFLTLELITREVTTNNHLEVFELYKYYLNTADGCTTNCSC